MENNKFNTSLAVYLLVPLIKAIQYNLLATIHTIQYVEINTVFTNPIKIKIPYVVVNLLRESF
jgi:hypothetical protein